MTVFTARPMLLGQTPYNWKGMTFKFKTVQHRELTQIIGENKKKKHATKTNLCYSFTA